MSAKFGELLFQVGRMINQEENSLYFGREIGYPVRAMHQIYIAILKAKIGRFLLNNE